MKDNKQSGVLRVNLKDAVDSLGYLFYVIDLNHKILLANSAAREKGIIEGGICYEKTHMRDRPCEGEDLCPLKDVLRLKKSVHIEHSHFNEKGNSVMMEVHGIPVFDEQGEVIQMIEYSIDITERKRMFEELRKNKELLLEVTAQVPGVVYQFYARPNGEFGFYYISSMSEHILGLKPDLEGYFERFTALVIPEHRESFVKSIAKSTKELSEWKYEGMLQKPTGEKIWFSGHSNPSPRENEVVFNGIVQDITERKKREQEDREIKQQIEFVLGATRTGLDIIDADLNVVYVDPEWQKIYGDHKGKKCYKYFMDRNEACPACGVSKALKTKEAVVTEEVMVKEGNRPVQITAIPFQNGKGEWLVAEVSTDITELKHSYNMLIQSEKMASLGRLVYEIAHEVNNPLMVVSGNAQIILMSRALNAEVKSALEIIMDQCQIATDIMHKVLKFAQPDKGEKINADIISTVEEVVGVIEKQFKLANIEIKRNYPNLPRLVSMNKQQMHEVFINLLNNAKEAMPNGGTITITVSSKGNFLIINLKDTGCGMSEEVMAKMFEPFFTTKESGTGLGLPICYGILKSHNGEIKFESQLNKGTTATILLPLRWW
ncbi:MAG: ATP-binding protein [Candidatus Omnitrophica bacterium]|nr:ATP-binding protein [Candidatus Omnitrophota bacterium]